MGGCETCELGFWNLSGYWAHELLQTEFPGEIKWDDNNWNAAEGPVRNFDVDSSQIYMYLEMLGLDMRVWRVLQEQKRSGFLWTKITRYTMFISPWLFFCACWNQGFSVLCSFFARPHSNSLRFRFVDFFEVYIVFIKKVFCSFDHKKFPLISKKSMTVIEWNKVVFKIEKFSLQLASTTI